MVIEPGSAKSITSSFRRPAGTFLRCAGNICIGGW